MTVSMYDITTPVFLSMFENLSGILTKAKSWTESKKIDESVIVNARLAPDMFPLSRQIQIACDAAKGCVARLSGVEVPSHEDNEKTLDELQARISKTVSFIKSCDRSKIEGSEDKAINLKVGGRELNMQGLPYVTAFVMPNLYFHITTTYAILRHNGLDIGKMDFLGSPDSVKKAA